LIDEALKAWVLEINCNPSLNIYFEGEYMAAQVPTEADICPVDYYVKSTVVTDTVNLVRKKDEPTSYESLNKIYPNPSDEGSPVSGLIIALRELFYKLAPIKSKWAVSSMNFEKMASCPMLK